MKTELMFSSKTPEWATIKGWPGYEIGSNGLLRSWLKSPNEKSVPKKPRILTGGINRYGYHRAVLCNGKKRQSILIHHLVLDTFVGERPRGYEARHKDGNCKNNHLSNLEWSTHHDNILDKIKHGTIARGERSGRSILKEWQVKRIFLSQDSLSTLAKRYGVDKCTIHGIKKQRNWGWLTKNL